jgi:GH25 family lysozyme M1 (1,4-beta-N-acetylmuramidase)
MAFPKIKDISYCQAVLNVDWAKLKALGVAVMIRMGQSTYQDTLFQAHYANAVKAGASFGVYWFYQPNQAPEPQITAFLNIYNALPLKPKVIGIDVENIAYTNPDGTKVNILPPNAAIHSAWLKTFATAIKTATGAKVGFYSRKDYWDAWTLHDSFWQKDFFCWVASWTNYSSDIHMMVDWTTWKIWQYEGGTGTQEGIVGPVDGNYFNGTQEEMVAFFGTETTPANTPVDTTPITPPAAADDNLGAKIVVLSVDDKNVNMPGISEADVIILKMCGQDGPEHANVYSDGAFPIRVEQTSAMRLGWVTLSTNYQLWVRQMMYQPFVDRKWYENETLKVLLQTWLKKPFLDQEWKQGLQLTNDPALWHEIDGLVLYMDGIKTSPGGSIGGIWQLAVLDDMLKNLKAFMDGSFIPKIKIYLLASASFYQTYAQDQYWLTLSNRLVNGWLSGIGIYETSDTSAYKDYLAAAKKTTELFTEVPMAHPFDHVSQIFDYRPAASYTPTCVPYGFTPSFTIYSANRFMAKDAFYEGAAISPLMVGQWKGQKKQAAIDLDMAHSVWVPVVTNPPVIDPPDDPPVDPPADDTQVKELSRIATLLQAILDKLTAFFDLFKTK